MAHPVVGTLVGGFRLESLLAEGSTGAVHAAVEVESERGVALKLLDPALAADERFRSRFLRESRIAAGLDHPHIVPTLAAGEADGALFIAMERVDGRDLRAVLREERRLDPARALSIVYQVGEALDRAHAAGLVHRDVKPGNILLESRDGEEWAYLCDFGLARHLTSASSLTGDRGFVGTIDYVPPEQIEGGAIDGRADVYALGCVLFECLTGRRPFERDSELAVVFAHLNEPPPRVSAADPALPAALDDVVSKALAKRPEARYATCAELVAAARAAISGGHSARRGRRRGLAAGAVAVGTVAAVAAIASVALRDAPPPRVVAATITPRAIDGVKLDQTAAAYEAELVLPGEEPGFTATKDIASGYTSLWFGRRKISVYFPPRAQRATIVTTWSRDYRTAAGVGPCSTLDELRKAYGKALRPSWAGTSPDGTKTWSWLVGRNLLFTAQTPDRRTITAVALYHGDGTSRSNNPESWANYFAANERSCV